MNMAKLLLILSLAFSLFLVQLNYSEAQEIRIIRDQIDKVQELRGSTNGQISTTTGEWITVNSNSEKERDKLLTFFSKVRASGEKIEIYMSGDILLGATSKKYGKIGKTSFDKADENVSIIGYFKGCSFGQGAVECGIKVKGKTIYISDQSSSNLVFKKINREEWIGKKIKLTGAMKADSNYFIAKSIELAQ